MTTFLNLLKMDLTVGPDLYIRGKGKSLRCDTRNIPQRMPTDEDIGLNGWDFRDAESIDRAYSHVGRKLASPSVSQQA